MIDRFINQLPDEGVYTLSPEGRITTWNIGAEQVTGYPAAEAIGRHLSFLYPPEEVSIGAPARELSRAERDGRSDAEGWRLHRSGERIWVSARMVAVRDDEGRLLGFARSERDTTERLRAEQELRLSEAKFSGMIAISTDAIVSVDEEQRIILFNRGAEEVFGYSAAEVMGMRLEMLLPREARAAHGAHVTAFGRGEQSGRAMGRHRSEIHGVRKDGTVFPAEASISRLDLEGRRIYTAVLRDVTERHETEKRIAELLAAEQEARAYAERATDRARFLADAGAALGASLELETTLRTLAELVVPRVADGCAVHVVEGGELRLIQVLHPGLDDAERERLMAQPVPSGARAWAVVHSGQSMCIPLEPGSDPGSPLGEAWARVGVHTLMLTPVKTRDGVVAVIGLAATRADLQFGEVELAMAEELGRRVSLAIENARLYDEARRASRARDDMLHAVSHDLGNSLGAVMVSTAVLLRTLPEDAPAAARERVAGIRALAEQMQRLRQDLLDAASIEAGRLSIDPEVQNPADLLRAAAAALGPVAEDRGLSIAVDAREAGPIYADGHRIQQVLGNLIGNALKFSAPGGVVTIGCEGTPEGARFWVTDTGSGISPEDLPHVFDRFWRTRESNRLGTGLGLAISQGIVQAHGGRIWVESERGAGSTFWVELPAEGLGIGD